MRNVHASPTSKMRVKSLASPVVTCHVLYSEHSKTPPTRLVPGALLQLVVVPDGGDHHQVAEYSQEAECHLQEHCGRGIIGGRVAEAGRCGHSLCVWIPT